MIALHPDARRRLEASRRLPVLDHLGASDPWTPWRPEQPSAAFLDGTAAGLRHLLALGLTPMPLASDLRALWKHGERELTEHIHNQTKAAA
jgi:hypothetical protein